MVDIVQIPVYQESIIVYVILSALIFGFVALTLFILVFFRRDYRDMLVKTVKMENRMQNFDQSLAGAETIGKRFKQMDKKIDKDLKAVETQADEIDEKIKGMGVYSKKQTKKMVKKMDNDLRSLKKFVTTSNRKDMQKIKRFMIDEEKQLDSEVMDMKEKMNKIEKKMKKDMNKKYKDLAIFFLFRIFDELSSEEDPGKVGKKLDDFRFFVRFSKKNNYWNKDLEKETLKFLKDMEKHWRSKSRDVSMLYSMFMDEVKGKE
jgi:Skp family chaperone for outer membrane proteins